MMSLKIKKRNGEDVSFNPQKISVKEIVSIIENTGTCEDPNAKVHKVKIKS